MGMFPGNRLIGYGVLAACSLLGAVPAHAVNYYVRIGGSDSFDGRASSRPFATIQKAASLAIAGDTVYVGGGTYTGPVAFANDGTASTPIRFVADTNGIYTGDGGDATVSSSGIVFDISGDNYIQLANFRLSGGTTGVKIHTSTGAQLVNCVIENTNGKAIDGYRSSCTVQETVIKSPNGDAVACVEGSFKLINCLISNANGHGVYSKTLNSSSSILHTTIASGNGDGINHDGGTLTVHNSIVANNNGAGLLKGTGTLTHDYNVVFSNSGGNFSGTSQSSNEYITDPKFAGPSDYHFLAGSPALDTGTDKGVSDDLEGTLRPLGTKVDLGCYEGVASTGAGAANEYFVRMSGNDSNSGTSPTQAFRTVKKAAQVAKAGSKIWVGAGTYPEPVTVANSGTSGQPIQFIADTDGVETNDPGSVQISGTGTYFVVTSKDYIWVSGFKLGSDSGKSSGNASDEDDVSEGSSTTVRWNSARGGRLTKCEITNGKDGLRVTNSEVTLDACYVHDSSDSGIIVEGSSSELTVRNSRVTRTGQRGLYIKSGKSVLLEYSEISDSRNHGIRIESDNTGDATDIRACKISGNKDGIHIHGRSKITLENCLVIQNSEEGILAHSDSPILTVNHCTVAYNRKTGVQIDKGNTSVRNTIIAFNGEDGLDKNGGTVTNSYCLVYGNTRRGFDGTSGGTGTVLADPKFVSAVDFHLQGSSPAIDKGTGSLSLDYDGGGRPVGTTVDIGCFEYGSVGGTGSGGTDYYVRMIGNDFRNGRTPQSAFRTIKKAATVAVPGDRVWVGAGLYPETLNLLNKVNTAAAPIKFIADTTGVATGDTGAVVVQGGFYLQNSSYFTVDGFTVEVNLVKPLWSSIAAGAYAMQSPNVTFQNLIVTGGQHGIAGENSASLVVNNCSARSASSHGQAFWLGTTATVQNCQAHANAGSGFYVTGGAVVNIFNGTTSSNASRGFHFDAARGSIGGGSSSNDNLAAELVGVNNDRTTLTVSNLTINDSGQSGIIARHCTASVLGGAGNFINSGTYGALADNAKLTVRNATIRSAQYGVQAINGSQLDLADCNISLCSNEGVYVSGGSANLANCTITYCRNGVLGVGNGTLSATTCTISNHSAWGINHTGLGSVNGCVLSNNYQGLYLTGATSRGDVTVSGTEIRDSSREGLIAIRCVGQIMNGAGTLSSGGSYGAYLLDSDLALDGVQITGSQYGVLAYSSTLAVPNATISGCTNDGVYSDGSSVTLTNTTIRDCDHGVRTLNNSTLDATACTFDGNRAWAVSHTGRGSISDCLVKNNNQGLYLVGASAMGDVTLSNTAIENTAREGLVVTRCTGSVVGGAGPFSQGGNYGAYLLESDLSISNVLISGSNYGVYADASTLSLTGAALSDCTSDGVYGNGSAMTLGNTTIARCRNGIFGENTSTLVADSTAVDACTAWGITHAGYGTLTGCTVNNCHQGMYLIGVSQPTDIQVTNGVIQGTTAEGLVAIRSSGNIIGGAGPLGQGGSYGAYLSQANFSLANVTIAGTERGVVALNSGLDLQGSSITSTTLAGVYAESSTVVLRNNSLSGCGGRGVDCQLDSTLTAESCTIENCGDWGLALVGFGTITSCQLTNNVSGANLTGKNVRGDIRLTDLEISGCSGSGLAAVRCEGTVRGGSGTLSAGGDWGIYSNDSRLIVTNATISGPTHGVQSALSHLTLNDIRISNATNGIVSDNDENLLLERARLENCSGWGLQQSQGNSQLINCLVTNNASGLQYNNPIQANLWNTTVVSTGLYGLHQTDGSADVKNTILMGNGSGTGVFVDGGSLALSHNLVYGFATPFTGIAPDANTLVKNPRFNNLAAGDYTLAVGSPAINAGIDMGGYADTDFLGTPRPSKRRWEIGAYESLLEGASFRVLEWSEER